MAREITVRSQAPPWGAASTSANRSVNLAQLLRRSIYTQDGAVGFWGTFLTMTRMMHGLSGWWSGPLRLSEEVLTWGDSLRKGFAEDLGIVLTTVVAGDYGWDGVGPQFFDNFKQYRGTKGSRPDLLFTRLDGLQVAAEGKCRILVDRTPPGSPPNSKQKEWLAHLDGWHAVTGLQWFLASAWATPAEIVLDLFDPGEPGQFLPSALLDAAVTSRDAAVCDTAPSQRLTLPSGAGASFASLTIGSSRSEDEATTLTVIVLDEPLDDIHTPSQRGGQAGLAVAMEDLMVAASGRIVVSLTRGQHEHDVGTLIGPHIGHPPPIGQADEGGPGEVVLRARLGKESGPRGQGYFASDGTFVVEVGYMRRDPQKTFRPGDHALRSTLEAEEAFLDPSPDEIGLIPIMHVRFRSPSEAARQILGRSANGRREWRTEDGRPIGEVLDSMKEAARSPGRRRRPGPLRRGGRGTPGQR